MRTLRGPRTRLDNSKAPALDLAHGELFVSNRDAVTVYPVGASGDVAPSRVIAGPNTRLTRPWDLAVDELHGEFYVLNHDDWGPEFSIFVYARDANGNVRPKRTIAGPKTALLYPTGIALDLVHDELLVANHRSVTVYPRLAEGDVAPSSELGSVMGPEGAFDSLSAIAYDPDRDELAVSSPTLDRVWVFPRLATNRSEVMIRSFSSGLKGPTGLALASE